MRYRIYYEDTDCGGVVYHSNYLKFCERARSEIFFQKDKLPFNAKGSFVVHSLNAQYLLPLRLGDVIEIKTILKEQRRSSILLRQEIFCVMSADKKNNESKVFAMDVRLAFIDSQTHRAIKIPLELLEILL